MGLNIDDLLNSNSYQHPTGKINLQETHISWIVLTGYFAYKIKKPVALPFLDFSTLQKRHYFCEQELQLNRRYSPDLYLDVVGVYLSGKHIYVGDMRNSDDVLLDYAVKMRQFPPENRLDKLLAIGSITAQDIDSLAKRIAHYHMQAKAYPDVRHGGTADEHSGEPEHVILPAMDNFKEIMIHPPSENSLEQERSIELWTIQQGQRLRKTMLQRKADGRVKDCHGDLHLENLYQNEGRIDAFDCIEFNADWRHIDVMNEVACLFVDLISRGHSEFAYRFINTYLECTGDYDGVRLLTFYAVYRAMVRAKVISLRLQQGISESEQQVFLQQYRDYIQLAESFCQQKEAALLVMCGLSASGKSSVARELMQELPGIRIRSDVERKRLHCYLPDEDCSASIKGGIYSSRASVEVYSRLHYLAKLVCLAGHTAIIDAACLQRSQRKAFRQLAVSIGRPILFVYCTASFEELQRRIEARSTAKQDVSDADIDVLCHQANSAELPDDTEGTDTIVIDTEKSNSIAESTNKLRSALSFKLGH